MKHMYLHPLRINPKVFLLAVVLAGALFTVDAQVYTARLSGDIEVPPNNSPGTGFTRVTINGNMMRVEANFQGLQGNVTVAHIHAPTPAPGSGTAGVATTLPTFQDFPVGVTAGSYDRTLDMTLASSYNPAYVNNNGGTTASAFAALKAALDEGKAYLNIHSNIYPPGEIRGFLQRCPTINVTIPDAFAMSSGVEANTVYPAYAPASVITLTTAIIGGGAPYSYNWSNGSMANAITVSPLVNTTYTVTVTDINGCPGTASKTINVIDISDGKKGDKILVCHNGKNTLSIASPAVAAHIRHGDMLGSCTNGNREGLLFTNLEEHREALTVRALSNPSSTHFSIQVNARTGSNVQVNVYDLHGRLIEKQTLAASTQLLRIGGDYKPGIYLIEIVQGKEKQTIRLVKGE